MGVSGIARIRATALEILTLVTGAASGQLLVLLVSPLLTRLYTPEQFGVLGIFTAGIAVLSAAAPLGYDQAIIGARHDTEAMHYVFGSVAAATVIGVLFAALSPVLAPYNDWAGNLWLVGIASIAAVALAASQAYLVRQRMVLAVSLGSFSNMGSRSAIQVAGGVAGFGSAGLVGGEILGRFIAVAVMDWGRPIRRALKFGPRDLPLVGRLLWDNRGFPLYQMPSTVLDAAIAWAPLPLIAAIYGPAWAGAATLIQRIATAPVSLFNQSMMQIYHQRAANLIHENPNRLFTLTVRILAASALMFIPIWVITYFFAPMLFVLVFGESWVKAGEIAVIWAPLTWLQIVSQMSNRLLILTNRQYVRLIANVAIAASIPASLFVGQSLGWEFSGSLTLMVCCNGVIGAAMAGAALQACRGLQASKPK